MGRTTINLNDEKVDAARRELGTSGIGETVEAALDFVIERRKRASSFDNPLIWGSPDLGNPEVMSGARR